MFGFLMSLLMALNVLYGPGIDRGVTVNYDHYGRVESVIDSYAKRTIVVMVKP